MKCCRCNLEINEEKDRWVNVRDFNMGKVEGEKNLHLTCWKNMIKQDIMNALKEKINQVMSMIKQ